MFGGLKTNLCTKCNKQISLNNYKRHVESCNGIKIKKIRGVDFDPNIGFKNGTRKQWNSGLTEKTDSRVSQYLETRRINNKPIGRCLDPDKELLRRQKLSCSAKKHGFGGYRPNAGRSKKFRVVDSFNNNVLLQSTYELECATILNDLKIKWIRPKSLLYDNKRYYPDFYLVDFDIFLDPKNSYKAKIDKDKIQKVREQNNVTIYIVLKENLNHEWFCNLIGKISV